MIQTCLRRKNPDNPPSKIPVVCGDCSKDIERRDRLKLHFDTCHPGKQPYEKGQTTLNFNSPSGARKRTVSQNDNILSPSDDRYMSDTSASVDTNDNISPLGSPLFTPISSNMDETDSEFTLTSEAALFPAPVSTQSSSSISVNENSLLIGQIGSLLGQLELNVCTPQSSMLPPQSLAVLPPPPLPVPRATTTPAQSSTMSNVQRKSKENCKLEIQLNCLKDAKCLKQVIELLDDVFELNFEQSELHCVVCFQASSRNGCFNVEDVEWERDTVQSQKFRNMTKLLRKHVKSNSHQDKIKAAAVTNLVVARRGDRNREMGRRLGTLAYFLYYNDLPFALYESLLLWFTLNNIDVGEINHSREFVRLFVDSVHALLIDRLKTFLQ